MSVERTGAGVLCQSRRSDPSARSPADRRQAFQTPQDIVEQERPVIVRAHAVTGQHDHRGIRAGRGEDLTDTCIDGRVDVAQRIAAERACDAGVVARVQTVVQGPELVAGAVRVPIDRREQVPRAALEQMQRNARLSTHTLDEPVAKRLPSGAVVHGQIAGPDRIGAEARDDLAGQSAGRAARRAVRIVKAPIGELKAQARANERRLGKIDDGHAAAGALERGPERLDRQACRR